MRKMRIEDVLSDTSITKLDKQNEYILHLFNDNYSEETVYNYNRDLSFFADFLKETSTPFDRITKVTITYFKGWIKQRRHIHKKDTVETAKSKLPQSGDKTMLSNGITVAQKRTDTVEAPKKVKKQTFKGGDVKNNNPEVLDAMSINRILVSLRNFMKFLVEFDYETPLAPDAVQLVRAPKKKPQVPTLQEVLTLVESPSSLEFDELIRLRNRAMLETLLATGMRISELLSINRNQLNSDGKLFITGKGRKQRFAYLTARAVTHIQAYLLMRHDAYPALFIPTRGSRLAGSDPRVSANYLQMKIAEYRRLLEIVIPISAHTIRHAFATYLAENGANPAAIQVLLGHESLQTTTKYVHTSDKFAEETHHEFHPAPIAE
jgi:site-specific recombinase XerD